MSVAETIKAKLTEALAPTDLQVIDESYKHAGHLGARPEGETHFHVAVTSDKFSGMMRVARQRLVYGILAEELAGPVHALSLETVAPGDPKRR
jgi:BolA protein